MTSICIGVHVHSEPENLSATLEALRSNTSISHDLLLLPDGPDQPTCAALTALRSLAQSGTEESSGAAACFNRLARRSDCDVVVLLESGSLVAPLWLEHLLEALAADPRNGLAGPTTNLAWNEQCVYPHSGSAATEIVRTGQQAEEHFGRTVQTLEPLYSLADFCYAVRREVIDSIGAADESYGLGPCWEMDYNIRAARAGYRGVWACAAYVHRVGFTARRRQEEARRFDTSRRLYQDKFCGARLRGTKDDYRSHCRGDACANFAPADLIRLRPPLHGDMPAVSAESRISAVSPPFVTCIMPTCNRRSFVNQAIRCFLRQDYANSELLIVDDGEDRIARLVPDDPRVRYISLERKLTIGTKRNLACRNARGDIIAHWDDDDWYPASRLRQQVHVMVEQRAEVCGTSSMFFFDANANSAFEYRYTATGRPWVAGSTLSYLKRVWERNNFPDIQVGEDSHFVWSGGNTRIFDLADADLCVATIHSANTSPKQTAGAFWTPQPLERVRQLMGDDLNFYRALSRAPLVSAIMPTFNRHSFVALAVDHFLQQDYPNKELVVLDDSDVAIPGIANLAGVRYIRLQTRRTIGAKRNLACEHAGGEIIAHWDDDDWYAPDRLRYQAAPIINDEADITGLENACVLELPEGQFWTTQRQLHQQMFFGDVHGGTLVFRKRLLSEGLRYPDINLAEDAWLLRQALHKGKRLVRLSNHGVFVYVRHGTNAWKECAPGRFVNPSGWQRIERPASVPVSLVDSYREAQRNCLRASSVPPSLSCSGRQGALSHEQLG